MKTTLLSITPDAGNGHLDSRVSQYRQDTQGYALPTLDFAVGSLPTAILPALGAVIQWLQGSAQSEGWSATRLLLESAGIAGEESATRPVLSLAISQRRADGATRGVQLSTEALPAEVRDALLSVWAAITA